MSAMSFRRALSATLLVAGVSVAAGAQDCAPTPLLGRRIAVGANVSHSTLDETSLGASLTGRVAGPLRLDGDYQSTRVADVDGLARGGRASLSAPLGFAGFALCPTAGVGYTRLSTTESSAEGRVTTRESRFGASLGRTFTFAGATSLTPFLEPLLVRQNVSWESIASSWVLHGEGSDNQTQLWFGVSIATSRSAVVARFRPKRGNDPREIGVGVVTAFGKH
jgi:hypothetical protein